MYPIPGFVGALWEPTVTWATWDCWSLQALGWAKGLSLWEFTGNRVAPPELDYCWGRLGLASRWSWVLTPLSSHWEHVTLHAGLPGLGRGVIRWCESISPFIPNASFLISMFLSTVRIPHLESLVLVKVFLCADSCSNWYFWEGMGTRNSYTTVLLMLLCLRESFSKIQHITESWSWKSP